MTTRPSLPRLWLARSDGPMPPGASAWLDLSEVGRLSRFVSIPERRRRLAAWSLRRWALSQTDPTVAESDWRFVGGPYGKPEIAAPLASRHLHHSLSHGGDYAVVLVSEWDCGVDVEARPAGLEAMEVALSRQERAVVASAPDPMTSFLQHWVAKEALLKQIGTGLAIAPDGVSLEVAADGQSARVIHAHGVEAAAIRDIDVKLWELPDGHWLAAALQPGAAKLQPTLVPWQSP